MSNISEFHNNLRRLLNIDMHELVTAGVIEPGDMKAWGEFRDNPWRWFITASDSRALKVWKIMERRALPRSAA